MIKKYFIAIVLPTAILNEVEEIKNKLYRDYNLKGALRSPAHITLHRPFEWKEEKESILTETLQKFVFKPEFTIELKNYNFFEPRVIFIDVLKSEILQDLHKQLTLFAKKELKLVNEANDLRGFYPHITVAFRDLKRPLFYELKHQFGALKFDSFFNYNGFSILKFNKKWEELVFIKS